MYRIKASNEQQFLYQPRFIDPQGNNIFGSRNCDGGMVEEVPDLGAIIGLSGKG